MKNYFKKMSLLLAVSSTIALTSSIGAFAADNSITGVSNLNATAQNSAKVGSGLSQPELGWIRFNQDNSNLTYSGFNRYTNDWTQTPNDTVLTGTLGASLKFNFVGNEIRLIAPVWVSHSSNIEISIDGKVETFSQSFGSGELEKRLVYEKLNLSGGEHTVVITNKEAKWLEFDAIDISEGGQIKAYNENIVKEEATAKVGDQLLQPEAGWTRFNQNDSNISYDSYWRSFRDTAEIDGGNQGGAIKFNFVGDKIRIIANKAFYLESNVEISIDGKVQTFSEASERVDEGILVFENLDLEAGEHSVVITSKSYDTINLDAIDINEGGQLKQYNKVISNEPIQNTAKVGDQLLQPEAGWTRFNQDNSNISYDSYWRSFRDTAEINGDGAIKFNFVGDKIRIIANKAFYLDSNVEISIDGKVQNFSEGSEGVDEGILVFENLGLENGEHSVVITSKSYDLINLDAIDINEGGQLKPYAELEAPSSLNFGDQVYEPEAGWIRFNYDNANLNYVGNGWGTFGDDMITNRTEDSVEFKFVGNDLRILGWVGTIQSNNIELSIDGVKQTISEYLEGSDTSSDRLVFEKLGLGDGEHTVVITNKGDGYMNIGAIDINEGGELKPYVIEVATTTPAAVQVTV